MNLLNVFEICAFTAGVVLSIVLVLFPRFGPASWTLVLVLVPGFMSAGVIGAVELLDWPAHESVFLSFACLVLCGTGGCLASYSLEREVPAGQYKKHRWFFAVITLAAPVLIAALYLAQPVPNQESEALQLFPLGPVGYGAAVYLLLVSVLALANLEQTLRSAEEHVRWEIKFLLLGLACVFGALIYVASQVLMYTPKYSLLSGQSIRIFPVIFLCSCLLIFHSWRRGTGRNRVVVSQGVVFSTITLFSVGLYLIGSSLLARWVGQWIEPGIPVEPIVFLVSAVVLASILLGTTFRHRTKAWIRRNLFAGKYDYRQSWMAATERIRATDTPLVAATALADLIGSTLGALNVGVWLRLQDSNTMALAAGLGDSFELLPAETVDLVDAVVEIHEPILANELTGEARARLPLGFLERTKTVLLAPLVSSGRVIGLLTVGSDRSGRPFDREAREFLRVLAVHSASEFHKSELLLTLVAAREAEAFQTFSTFLLHDLKNFASTLTLIAKNATRHHANPDFQLDAFQSILETSEKMKKLCNSLRTFSVTLATNQQLYDLNQLVRSVAQSFEMSLSQRLELKLEPLPMVFADSEEMARVLQNLVLNAHEASVEGLIRLSTTCDAERVTITVTDQGKGISQEFMEKELFQPFHTTKGDGLGIGLFQSKKILEAHGGKIEVESELGKGTVVRLILPIGKDPLSSLTSISPVPIDAADAVPEPAMQDDLRRREKKSELRAATSSS